ncbi:MAG: RsmB/NOP family class I SAM-dependent RNA methyltransferase [Lentisphaeria bacterium]
MAQNIQPKSVPDEVLAAVCKALKQWANGISLQNLQSPVSGDRRIINHTLLVYFRRRGTIDWTIDQMSRRGKVNRKLRDILRIGITQILYMDGIPPAAVTDTCVRHARRTRGKKPAGFVNALLRNLIRTGRDNWFAEIRQNAPRHVRLNLSKELYDQWRQRMNKEDLERLADLLNSPAPLTVRRRSLAQSITPTEAPDYLTPVDAPEWLPAADLFECRDPQAFFKSDAFINQQYYVQDPATLLAPALLDPYPEELVADLCAAPGGKTLLMAELADNKATIIAGDRSSKRLQRLLDNMPSEGRIVPVAGDAAIPYLKAQSLDAILLDVPCSNTGVIRRRPDVKWRFTRQNLQDIVKLQKNILAATATAVRPGGRLVYSTCSIEPEENSEQVQNFCNRHENFRVSSERLLLPSEDHDGAYAAVLQKIR